MSNLCGGSWASPSTSVSKGGKAVFEGVWFTFWSHRKGWCALLIWVWNMWRGLQTLEVRAPQQGGFAAPPDAALHHVVLPTFPGLWYFGCFSLKTYPISETNILWRVNTVWKKTWLLTTSCFQSWLYLNHSWHSSAVFFRTKHQFSYDAGETFGVALRLVRLPSKLCSTRLGWGHGFITCPCLKTMPRRAGGRVPMLGVFFKNK